jgi:uncharacterized protein
MRALDRKMERLRGIIGSMGSAAVAFSGGTDSTLVTKIARQELGSRSLAVTIASPLFPASELAQAKAVARRIGIEHIVLRLDPLTEKSFVANRPDRCYLCKLGDFREIIAVAKERGFDNVVDGSNVDDSKDFRPGAKAKEELGVRSPLAEAGMGKADVRAVSKLLGLPTSTKGSSPCLASRIPYGEEITKDKLRMVEEAEDFLKGLGFRDVRVRVHGNIARIEVSPGQLKRLSSDPVREKTARKLKALGFAYVTLDMEGYRMGSLNEVLRA